MYFRTNQSVKTEENDFVDSGLFPSDTELYCGGSKNSKGTPNYYLAKIGQKLRDNEENWTGSLWPSGWSVCLPSRRSVQIRHPTSAETRMWGKRLAAVCGESNWGTGRVVIPEVNLRECISCTPLQSLLWL